MPAKKATIPFDKAYYDRFYESKATRVHGAERIAHLARFVTGFIAWSGGRLDSVLDVGAGAGLWRDWFAKNERAVKYRSTEYSAYACERYGHEQRDISKWRAKEKFDLIVCQGVLPYLADAACEAAIDNLGAMARGFLYLEAITRKDWDEVCDQDATDGDVHLRTAAWYRARLGKHFMGIGSGLWYVSRGPLTFYELERL